VKEQSSIEQYKQIADQLDEMQKTENNGRGIECVRWIISDLRQGDFKMAKTDYRNQSDKYDNYPHIRQFLKEVGIAEDIDLSKYLKDEEDL
jgi:hypothetical protein